MNETAIGERTIDSYRVYLYKWGQYTVENPSDGKFRQEHLPDEINWDNVDECWEYIQHDIHDLNPNFYLEELGNPTEKHEMDWNEGQPEIQDEDGNVRKVIIINDGTVQYWAVLDRTVDEAIADFCRTYEYSDDHEGESIEIGVDVVDEIDGDVLEYKLGSHDYPHMKE
jgi:hypothetical protein